MLTVSNVGLRYGDKKLFEEVNLKFTPGNCYGVIGANGAGKSTFLKILAGEIEPNTGHVSYPKDIRMSVLKQDHYQYDELPVLETVIRGNERLFEITQQKNALYMKEDFSEEDGILAAELEGEFADLNGWEAESDAASLLQGLGVPTELHDKLMKELTGAEKVKVLLAQALFGNPGILVLDEPTNHLDIQSINWLEEFLINFEGTVIVVSHDRHFLNKVCTHICDVDFGKIKLFVGNYDFWYESSQLLNRMAKEQNKKKEEQIKELQEFIARFSANASKSKQATSRKKQLEKITLDDIKPSSRKYPFIKFEMERELGNDLVKVENVSHTIDGEKILDNVSFIIRPGEKVALLSRNDLATTTLMQILAGEIESDEGTVTWGQTTSQSYMSKDLNASFDNDELSILDWLRQFATKEQNDNTFLRGFLGKMLFSGDDIDKQIKVLSGGEKVRCILAKMMLERANVLLMDDPTNHLDLESITSLNDSMIDFKGSIIFTSHDHEYIQTIANHIIEVGPKGIVDRFDTTYDEFLALDSVQEQVEKLY